MSSSTGVAASAARIADAPRRRRARVFTARRLVSGLIALPTACVLGVILGAFLTPAPEIWGHMVEYVLPDVTRNTLRLVLGVSVVTTVLGVGLGWLTGGCDFPGRRFFSWALMLPMAMPAYVMAFVALGLFDVLGPVQSTLRALNPALPGWVPDMRSTGGVIAVLSLTLYPYVYLFARGAFLTQGAAAVDAARILGDSPGRAFFRVALPMARPWIAAGLLLVIMETLADFGAVSIFNYDTFTTAIYKAWYGFFSLEAAAQFASLLVVVALVVHGLERVSRARMRFTQTGRSGEAGRVRLAGWRAWGAVLLCGWVFLIAFAAPTLQLVAWTAEAFWLEFDARYAGLLLRSLTLAGLATLTICFVALTLAYVRRGNRDRATAIAARISTLGYALPGTVLAVGVYIPAAFLDHLLMDAAGRLGLEMGPLLTGTVALMIIAYLIRFMAVGFGAVDAGLTRIAGSVDEAARLLGARGARLLLRLHAPMLRRALLTAAILVFVDVLKEMPMTLMTRPFGWDTLPVKIFELTSEGEWERAALPALSLVLAGLVPVVLLIRNTERDPASGGKATE